MKAPPARQLSASADRLLAAAERSRLVGYGLRLLPGGDILEGELFQRLRNERAHRVAVFQEQLGQRLEELEIEALRYEYLDSESFLLIFENVLHRVVRSQQKEKIERFAQITANAIRGQVDFSSTENYFLNCVDRLDELHVWYLYRLRERAECEALTEIATIAAADSPQRLNEDDLLALQATLAGLHLVAELSRRGSILLSPVKLTSLGFRFLRFLED